MEAILDLGQITGVKLNRSELDVSKAIENGWHYLPSEIIDLGINCLWLAKMIKLKASMVIG